MKNNLINGPKLSIAQKVIIGFIAVIWLVIVINTCSEKEVGEKIEVVKRFSAPEEITNTQEDIRRAEIEANGYWAYGQEYDRMTEETRYLAAVKSPELVYFDFPYQGGSELTMTIRKRGSVLDIYFKISNGQFLTNQMARIKFDDGKPFDVSLIEPADYSTGLIFIDYTSKVLARIKKSNIMIIELPFYQEGNRSFIFDVRKLKWEH